MSATTAPSHFNTPRLFGTRNNRDNSAGLSAQRSAFTPPLALIFDTETTGLVNRKKPYTDPAQPELVQLGMILVDTVDWKKRLQVSLLVKSNTKSMMDPKAQQVHGISDADRDAFGVPLTTALQLFQDACAVADCLVAHNMPFDRTVLQASFHRAEGIAVQPSQLAEKQPQTQLPPVGQQIFDTIPQICTMEVCTDILQLPQRYGKHYKWPSLKESYLHFTTNPNTTGSSSLSMEEDSNKQGIQNAHDALADAEACLVVLRGLLDSQDMDPIEKLVGPKRSDNTDVNQADASVNPNLTSTATSNDEPVKSTQSSPGQSKPPTTAQDNTTPTAAAATAPQGGGTVAQPGELILKLHGTGFAVHGNTYKYKESLKALGATWSASRRAWVFDCHSMLEPARKLAGIVPVAVDGC